MADSFYPLKDNLGTNYNIKIIDNGDGTYGFSSSLPSGGASAANQTSPLSPVAPAAATATKSMLQGGIYNTVPPTFTNGQQGAIQLTARGSLEVDTINAEGSALSNAGGFSTLLECRGSNKSGVGGQYIRPIAAETGAQIIKPYSIPSEEWSYAAAAGGISNTTTAVTLVTANASERNYLTAIQISNSTLGAGGEIVIRNGAAGPVLWRGILSTTASDPVTITFPDPLKGSTNTLLEFATLTASVTGAVYVNAQGYQAP